MSIFKVKREHGSPQHTADLAGCQASLTPTTTCFRVSARNSHLSSVMSSLMFMALSTTVLLLVCVLLGNWLTFGKFHLDQKSKSELSSISPEGFSGLTRVESTWMIEDRISVSSPTWRDAQFSLYIKNSSLFFNCSITQGCDGWWSSTTPRRALVKNVLHCLICVSYLSTNLSLREASFSWHTNFPWHYPMCKKKSNAMIPWSLFWDVKEKK